MFPNYEEITSLEKELKKLPANIPNAETMKKCLRMGLAAFERLVSDLPEKEQRAAILLYLARIRKEAFQLHLAVLTAATKQKACSLNAWEIPAQVIRYAEELENLARIYAFL